MTAAAPGDARPDYGGIYTENYFSGRDSFFYRIFGGYKDIRPYFDRLARWFEPYVVGPAILDIGCAFGYFLGRFRGRGRLFGVDVSAYAVEVARRVLPDAEFAVAPLAVEALPFADATFGTAITTDVLEHLAYDDQPRAIDDVRRILRPGGRWLITTPNYGRLRRLFYRIPDRMEHHFGMRRHDDWLRLFGERGLIVRDWWTYPHGMLPFRWRRGGFPEFAAVLERPPAAP